MEPILVPGTPKEAFNKHRRISDLIRKQVEHFKHVEEKLPDDVRASLPQHDIVTENEAARYISAMTSYLLSRPVAASPKIPKKAPNPKRPVATSSRPALAIAAAAETPARKKAAATKKAASKTVSSKTAASKKKTPTAKKSSSNPKAGRSSRKRTK
jgi:colicin import membrane protein